MLWKPQFLFHFTSTSVEGGNIVYLFSHTEILHQQFSACSEAESRKVYNEDNAASACIPSLVHSGRRPEPEGEGKEANRPTQN